MSTSVEYFDCLISWCNLNLIQYWELSQVPRLILRPDLKARGLLFSSFCWRLLWYEQDFSYGIRLFQIRLWQPVFVVFHDLPGSRTWNLNVWYSIPTIWIWLFVKFLMSSVAFTPRKPFNDNTPGLCSFTWDNTSSSTDSDVNRFSFGFVISLWLQHGNVGIGRLWRTSAFTLQPNLVKLRP